MELLGFVSHRIPRNVAQVTFQALTHLTNAVLRDSRVIELRNTDWLSKYNDQGAFSRFLCYYGAKA